MTGTVNFPTRITTTSCSAIDNIFVDERRKYTIKQCINGLSDHDAQLLTLNDLEQPVSDSKPCYIRNINKITIAEFQSLLSEKLWEDVFENSDVNIMFKNFLNNYLRCFNACFLKVNISKTYLTCSEWITNGIKISCKRKKELFVLCKITNNYNLKLYYKKYCVILITVIRNAKKLHYNNIILKSKNKMKSTWKIINNEKSRPYQDTSPTMLKFEDTLIDNQRKIADILNYYFLTTADDSKGNVNNGINPTTDNPINYLYKYYNKPFPMIQWQYVSMYEIKFAIHYLSTDLYL